MKRMTPEQEAALLEEFRDKRMTREQEDALLEEFRKNENPGS